MAQRIDHLTQALVEKVADLIRQRCDGPAQQQVQRLLKACYANVAPEDILKREPEALLGSVLALYAQSRQRADGQAKLRVYRPSADEYGWESEHSVVEMINDDMPFLVDSLTAALGRRDIAVHLIIHPIVPVLRDATGRLVDILDSPADGSRLESFMHIEIDRQPADMVAGLVDNLSSVLTDVRTAVADWSSMRERTVAVRAELDHPLPGIDAADVAEASDFLRWMRDGNFTYLGYRCLEFANAGGAADAAADTRVEQGSGLGLLRDDRVHLFDTESDMAALSPEMGAFLRRPLLLLLAKADLVATVHRPVPMDIVGVKRFDADGRVTGMHCLVGLFTHTAYTLSPSLIPVLRRKVARIAERAGFLPASHDGKSLQAILENYPRDELLQANDEVLFDTALGILRLQERQRVAIFLRRDEFERFVSILVFIPRDRFDTRLRLQVQGLVEEAFAGKMSGWYTQVGDSPLARLHLIVKTRPGVVPQIDPPALEARLADLARSWVDRLQEGLVERYGEDRGLTLYRRWGASFPLSYREATPAGAAVADIARIEAMAEGFGLHLFRPVAAAESEARFKVYRQGQPVALSDVLPLFEHMGFRAISEDSHPLRHGGGDALWVHEFTLVTLTGEALDIERLRGAVEDAFRAVWQGEAEDDGFNRLVVAAGLTWRQVMVLRAYSKYLRQTGSTFSQSYVERSITGNPAVAVLLVELFERRFDPAQATDGSQTAAAIEQALEAVGSADDDRILRRFLDFIDCTLRTNYYQTAADGKPKPYLSIKLDSQRVQGLPLPRPLVEIFVYSPRTESIHLRGGRLSRGGIRWSDRPEDFRTEVLGLMKAQMVKNAVIVPVGAKGGFVLKRPTRREALMDEGIACYRILIRGLLDVTDNLVGGQVVPPRLVVRRDGDDPYLVVAADKGTASFSDIANEVSAEYGFWLGDAFASGGSRGYDHKALAITARGAWESVKRHFRELGRDTQQQDFTVIGVGDMSGDVFGNGMLRSRHARLLAAFDHRHIFVDPNPLPAVSFDERQRLADLPRSSWADYDPAKLSAGGAVFPRDAKQVHLSDQAKERFGIEAEALSPTELIRALLKQPVDLLWFGGIGTYVKAALENHADVGDRANDAVRLDARQLRCKVIGEGANLALTQRARVEAGLAGIRLNVDAIDNSGGVDCSDHEVNIKILLDSAVADGDLTVKQRNELLVHMAAEVSDLVLRNNYMQSQAISVFHAQAPLLLDQQERFMRLLERSGRLDRAVEFLPPDEELTQRAHSGIGLTRPEISILLAYGKMWLFDAVVDSDLPDDPLLLDELVRYFPGPLRSAEWRQRMVRHRLRREIIAETVVNSMINRFGGSYVARLMERTGSPAAEVVRAYLIVRASFRLRELWELIEGLDNKVPAEVQTAMLIEVNRLIERGIGWVLSHAARPIDIGRLTSELEPGSRVLEDDFRQVLPSDTQAALDQREDEYRRAGVPGPLAGRIAGLILLASANDISSIAKTTGRPFDQVARLYFIITARFGLGWLRAAAERLAGGSHWQTLAMDAVIDDLYGRQAALTASVAATDGTLSVGQALVAWIEQRRLAVERTDQLLGELKMAGKLDLATLVVAAHQFGGLSEG
jgi:glutamate dehydrogenase